MVTEIYDICYMGKPHKNTLKQLKAIKGIEDALLVNTEPNGRGCCELLVLTDDENLVRSITMSLMGKYDDVTQTNWETLKQQYGDVKVP